VPILRKTSPGALRPISPSCRSGAVLSRVALRSAIASLFDPGTKGTAREPCDEALMVPNLDVEAGRQLYRLLDCFFVVGTLHNFGDLKK
jgi:hypothetical protein